MQAHEKHENRPDRGPKNVGSVLVFAGAEWYLFSSPNMSEHSERVIRTIRNEALDYFIVFGEDHLNRIVSSFVEYYNTLRPHQGLENIPLSGTVPEEQSVNVDPDEVVCEKWLGRVLKHYERRASRKRPETASGLLMACF